MEPISDFAARALNSVAEAQAVDNFRKRYRSFRQGYAKGAKGSIAGLSNPQGDDVSPKCSEERTRRELQLQTLLHSAADIASDYLLASMNESTKVVKLASPEHLRSAIDVTLSKEGRSDVQVLESLRRVLDYSMRTSHPNFHNQLFAGCHPMGIAGEILSTVANSSMYTFEVAPSFLVLEEEVFYRMREYFGWNEGSRGEGMFCPGGSLSNFYGMNLARYWACRRAGVDIKRDGMRAAPDLVAFVSDQGHYSAKKAAAFLGLGTSSVISIKTDSRGRMVIDDLRTQIAAARANGRVPFYVQATAGTTVLGAFDDFNAIVDLCSEGGEADRLWIHVDGCWGASVVLSTNHRQLMDGVSRCDSLAWNPHKLMMTPLQCSAFLVPSKNCGLMRAAHSANAKYLFQEDKLNASLDTGDLSVQCGRKVDVVKLWAAWASMGSAGYAAHIDRIMHLARYLEARIKSRSESFVLVTEGMCTNVCFWFVPPSVRAPSSPPSTAWSEEKRASTSPPSTAWSFFRRRTWNEIERLGADL